MNVRFLLICLVMLPFVGWSQLDNSSNTVQFDAVEDNYKAPDGLSLPAIEKPSLTNRRNPISPNTDSNLGLEEEKPISISTDDGLLDNKTNKAPKYFTKDKEPSEEYARDQYLGQHKTGSQFVKIQYRDHEHVDGDLIRVFVNEDIVQSRVYLTGEFKGFTLHLEEGFNRIEFQAINQGSSGPNTAELHIYDDNGMIISAKEWNLLTGYKASFIVIKD